MAIGDRILGFGDLPFAFALVGFLASLQSSSSDMISHLTAIALLGGLLSAVLTIVEPVERTIGFFVVRYFRGDAITNLTGTFRPNQTSNPIINPNTAFDLAPMTDQVWNSTTTSYLKNRITAKVYTLSFLLVVAFSLLSLNKATRDYLNIDAFVSGALGFLVLIGAVWIGMILVRQLRALPTHIRVADIYMMKVEGTLPAGNYFNNLETAIRLNDWVTARYWARRSHLEGDFQPSP